MFRACDFKTVISHFWQAMPKTHALVLIKNKSQYTFFRSQLVIVFCPKFQIFTPIDATTAPAINKRNTGSVCFRLSLVSPNASISLNVFTFENRKMAIWASRRPPAARSHKVKSINSKKSFCRRAGLS